MGHIRGFHSVVGREFVAVSVRGMDPLHRSHHTCSLCGWAKDGRAAWHRSFDKGHPERHRVVVGRKLVGALALSTPDPPESLRQKASPQACLDALLSRSRIELSFFFQNGMCGIPS